MDNPKEKFFTLTDNLFTFSSYACDCVVDIENVKPGEIKETIKMQSIPSKPLRFAFTPSRGMVRLADTGAINSERVLTDILAVPEGNKKALFKFFTEYGFFFPISTSDYEAFDIDALFGFINRIKAVVHLMSAVSEAKKDYQRILGLVMYLQLSRPIELLVSCFGEQPFTTQIHEVLSTMEMPVATHAEFHQSESGIIGITNMDSPHYNSTVPDTIFTPSYELAFNDFRNISGGFDEAPIGTKQSQMFRSITRLYAKAPHLPSELRKVIDFYFHFQHQIGVVKHYSSDGTVEFFDSADTVKKRYKSHFDAPMKQALVDIAKSVIRDEIGYNIGGMRPRYDIETMSPAWEIQDLLTGIYVSIFFMRPGVELYRKCANHSCERAFLVNTTSAKRKYCSSSCRNAAAQRAHRFRKQEIHQ